MLSDERISKIQLTSVLQSILRDAELFAELFYAIRIVLQKQNISIHYQADEGAWIVIDQKGETGDVSKFHKLEDAIAWAFKEPEE